MPTDIVEPKTTDTGGSSESPQPQQTQPQKVFRIHRFQIGLNVLIQILAVVFILGMLNYVAFNYFKRWDFSRDKKYALSDQTKRVLKSLEKPVKIIIFFTPDPRVPGGEIYDDVQNLLKEYQYASKKIDVETVNPFKALSRARELQAKYKFGASENVLIVDAGEGHSKFVNATDMAEYDESGVEMGQPPRLKAFKGEQAITSALLEVTESKQNKIYVLGGKGGPDLKSDELAGIKTYIERQNVKIDTLNLLNVDKVPDDVRALLIIGPRYDLTDRELKLLRDFWDKNGRIFIALDPGSSTPKLLGFLATLGVKPDDDRILRTVNLGFATGVMRQVAASFSETSAVTKRLKGVDTMFDGDTQSLTLDPAAANAKNLSDDPIITAAEGYWGETKYQNVTETGAFFDPKEDKAAPLVIAASVEKNALPDQRVQVENSSRMIVVGNSRFITTASLNEPNVDFTLASLNWLLNREELIGIAPKENKQFTLNLSDEQVRNLMLLVMFIIPGAAALVGFGAWFSRRR